VLALSRSDPSRGCMCGSASRDALPTFLAWPVRCHRLRSQAPAVVLDSCLSLGHVLHPKAEFAIRTFASSFNKYATEPRATMESYPLF